MLSASAEIPVHLLVALTIASSSLSGPDGREIFAVKFARAASRNLSQVRMFDAPSGPNTVPIASPTEIGFAGADRAALIGSHRSSTIGR